MKNSRRKTSKTQDWLDVARPLAIIVLAQRIFGEFLQIPQIQKRHLTVDLRAISSGRFSHFDEFPPAMQRAAWARRSAILRYHKAVEEGRTKERAKKLAAAEWKKFFGKKCAERTVRNWVARARELGGSEARLEAFLDLKACAHPKQRCYNPNK